MEPRLILINLLVKLGVAASAASILGRSVEFKSLLCRFIAGQLRVIAPDREDIWSFSPFIDLSIYRWIRRNLPRPRLFDWQIMFFVTIVVLRLLQTEVSRFLPHATFSLESPKPWVEALIYATSIMVIGTELKIWNSVR